jgi:hypothetical protein
MQTRPGDLLDLATAQELLRQLPVAAFVRQAAGPGAQKSYRNFSRTIVSPDGTVDDDLPPIWAELIGELIGPAYRADVARTLDLPPVDALEIRLVRHAPGDWLGPHTDRQDKIFSHVLYLNPQWDPAWGGCLQILGSADPHDVVATIAPELGASAVLVRAENSWHQVSRLAAAQTRERVSLLVHGLAR